MEGHFFKLDEMLVPANDETRESLKGMARGEVVKVKYTKARNYQFHKKYFALLNHAYEVWEPEGYETPAYLSAKGIEPGKNFDRFRKNIAILAGFHDGASINLNGDVRIEAKSISFGKMSEDEFADLYDKTINVILQKILTNYTKDDLDLVVEGILQFS